MSSKTRLPTAGEIDELVAFLPKLYAPGFQPVRRWQGGQRQEDGSIVLPWPEYDPLVTDFFKAAARECWLDTDYRPEEAARMLENEAAVQAASLVQIKTLLTYAVRGERFGDGHWAAMVEGGHIRRILERLVELRSQGLE